GGVLRIRMAAAHGEDAVGEGDRARGLPGEITPIDGGAVMVADGAAGAIEGIRLRATRIGEGSYRYIVQGRVRARPEVQRRGNDGRIGYVHLVGGGTGHVDVVRDRHRDRIVSLLAIGMRARSE